MTRRAFGLARMLGVAGLAALVSTCDLLTEPGIEGIVIAYLSDTTLVVGTTIHPSWSLTIDGRAQPDPRFRLTSSDNAVAVISASGDSIRIVGRGRATINATVIGSTIGDTPPTHDVPVRAVAARVTVDTAAVLLESLSDTLAVGAVALDAVGDVIPDTPIGWESTDPAVATVDAQGRVVSRANGTASIHALVDDDTATVAVTVSQRLVAYGFTPPAALLDAFGAETTLVLTPLDARANPIVTGVTLPTPTWSSLDGAIASVDATGRVTAVANGETGIVASASGVTDTAAVEVDQRATTVLINGPSVVNLVAISDSVRLVAFAFDRFNSSVLDNIPLWVSLDLSVATVEAQTGIVRALGVGSVSIVAQLDGAADTVTVVVTNDPVTLDVTPNTASISSVGDQVQFTPTVRNALGAILSGVAVDWSVGDGAIASVSATGLLTSLSVGTTVVVGEVAGTTIRDTSTVTINDIPETVDLTVASVTLASINDSATPPANIRNGRGDILDRTAVTWTTSDPAIATVTSGGIVVARGRGDATVTATSPFNAARTDQVAVTVTNAPETITLNRTLDTLTAPTRTLQYTAVVENARGDVIANEPITWSTSVGSVASIDAAGEATALAVGTTVITAEVGSGPGLRSDMATLVVINEAVSVTVSPPEATINSVGDNLQVVATAKNDVGGAVTGVTFTWTTSDATVATVTGAGLVQGVGVGTVAIRATLDSLFAEATITVTNSPSVVDLYPDSAMAASVVLESVNDSLIPPVTLENALGQPLLRSSASWSSSANAVAQVTGEGTIIATGRGNAVIFAQNPLNAARRDSVFVEVTNSPDAVVISPSAVAIPSLGQQTDLDVAVFNKRGDAIPGEPVTWMSLDPGVASVTQTGLVTAITVGVATIQATAGAVSNTATVTVTNLASTVTVDPASATITSLGDTVFLTATARNVSGNIIPDPTVTWQTSDAGVVTVDLSDSTLTLVTATGVGSASVSATVDGVTTSSTVTVTDQPTTIMFTSGDTTLASVTDAYSPGITIENSIGDPLPRTSAVWSTTDGNVVTVSGSGVVTAVGAGTAQVAAVSSFNNTIGDTIEVVVTNAPFSITLNRTLDTLSAVGLSLGYTAEVRNEANGIIPGAVVTWSSSAMGVATIGSGSGTATGVGVGTTTITGTTTNALTANATLVVTNDAVSITVTPARDTIENLGGQLQLSVNAPNEIGTQVPANVIAWSTLDPTIASVDADGLVTASATTTGLARIVATTNTDPIADTSLITVADAPQTVQFTSVDTTLASLGDAYSPGASILNANLDPLPRTAVTWSSSATQIATVSNSGVVTAAGVGDATITMTSPFNPTLTSSIVVTVTNAPDSVVLNSEDETLTALTRTFTFSATVVNAAGNPISGEAVTWMSSDDNIATISPVGVATGVAIGAVTITATVTSAPGVTSDAALTVENNATTITLAPGALSLASVGLDSLVTATVRNDLGNPIPNSSIRWSTSNAAVFTVPAVATQDTGRVTAAGAGSATLTGKVQVGATTDSISAAITVTVSNDPDILDITSGDTTLTSLDDTFTPGTDFQNGNGDPLPPGAANWVSSNTAVATVTGDGLVTAQSVGTAFIKAISPADSDNRDSILVTVQNVPDQVTINSARDTLTAVTQTLDYSATVLNARGDEIVGAAVTWNTSDGALVGVDGNGLITALAVTPDSVEITATSGPVTSDPTIVAVKDPTALYVDKDDPANPRFGTIKAPYATIQAAIDAATPGDTVFVNAAATAYTGGVNVTSSIVIQGIDTVAAGCTATACTDPTALPTIGYNSGSQGITAADFTTVTIRHLALASGAAGPAVSMSGVELNLEFFYINPAGPPTVRGRGILVANVTVASSATIRRTVVQHVNGYGIRLSDVTGMRIDSVEVTDASSVSGIGLGAGVHHFSGASDTIRNSRFYLNNVGVEFGTPTGLVLTGNDIFDNDSVGGANLPTDNAHLANWWGDARGPRRDLTTFTTTADSAAAGDTVSFAGAFVPDYSFAQGAANYPAAGGATPASLLAVRGGGQTQAVIGTVPFAMTARVVDADHQPITGENVNFEITALCDQTGGSANRDDIDDAGGTSCGPLGVATNADGLAETVLGLGDADGTRTVTASSGILSDTFLVTKFSTVDPDNSDVDAADASITADGVASTTITVTLRDAGNVQLPSGGDGVELTTTAGTLSAVTDNDDGTYTATLTSTTLVETATVTATVNEVLLTDNATVDFVAGPATTLTVTAITDPVTAGVASDMTVTAFDQFNNIATGYTGTVTFTSSDGGGGVALPADYTFTGGDAGVHTFVGEVTLVTAGEQSVTATDTGDGTINGTQTDITVDPDVAVTLTVTGITDPVTAGVASDVTVTALDQFNNVATGYTGTVTFTSSDGAGGVVLPADYTFTGGDAGVHTFVGEVTLETAGEQTVTATDTGNGTINGTQIDITVDPDVAVTLTVSGITDPVTAGTASDVTVTALDQFGNVATGYTGTVSFTSTDPGGGVALPADYTFTGGDAGVHTFVGEVTLVTAGEQSVTATDTGNGTINGTQTDITVNPDVAVTLTVTGIDDPIGTGVPSDVTVTALDQFGNVATDYTGTVTFTTSDADGGVILPADYTFTGLGGDDGVHTFVGGVTLITIGEQSVTATDDVDLGITGSQIDITVQ